MTHLTIYGASDDIVVVDDRSDEGPDLSEEFSYDEEGSYLALSDGTALSVRYDDDGIWRINRVVAGDLSYDKSEAISDEGSRPDGTPAYSDVAVLSGDAAVRWVQYGRLHWHGLLDSRS